MQIAFTFASNKLRFIIAKMCQNKINITSLDNRFVMIFLLGNIILSSVLSFSFFLIFPLPFSILPSSPAIHLHINHFICIYLHINQIAYFQLPISEIIIEQLFTSPYRQRLIDFAEMIVKSESSSAVIVANLIESSNDAFILDLNARIPLAKIIAAKVDWNTKETLIIRALLDVIDVTKGSLNDFVKVSNH